MPHHVEDISPPPSALIPVPTKQQQLVLKTSISALNGAAAVPVSKADSLRRNPSGAQHSQFAKTLLMNKTAQADLDRRTNDVSAAATATTAPATTTTKTATAELLPVQPPTSAPSSVSSEPKNSDLKPPAATKPAVVSPRQLSSNAGGVGPALSDTPLPSAPGSPRVSALRQNSTSSTPRLRPTTLDIPGLTKSKVSPDGRIARRDVGSKLIIIMVGLPARGKSYITKKLTRYLNWLQHDAKIFNVGERRRLAAVQVPDLPDLNGPERAATALLHSAENLPSFTLPEPLSPDVTPAHSRDASEQSTSSQTSEAEHNHQDVKEHIDHNAEFFDPNNQRAAQIREQCAIDTLEDLFHYILEENGAVGILDATNSTLTRRKMVIDRIRQRAPDVNVLFIESVCEDEHILESNMRLKLSGPDYRDKDPIASLEDFKKRVAMYEKNYVPIGEYEEKNNLPYVKMIDVGRKVISHQIKGFLSSQAVYYLLNFNLAPRQIWITRHGESMDNVAGKIGGDSDLSANGIRYSQALARFVSHKRNEWELYQQEKAAKSHFPPHPGDHTPPNPYSEPDPLAERNFCVWTSMLQRSIQSSQFFNDEDFEIKQMRMLDELYAGKMEGLTYKEIQTKYSDEYAQRQRDKLSYRYPGQGGEGYLDVINRVRPVIVELERMTDHCLLITHRSVARVLLAYFLGLERSKVADLFCPLGLLYCLEPKPYGVEFKAYRYNAQTNWFDHDPEFQIRKSDSHHD